MKNKPEKPKNTRSISPDEGGSACSVISTRELQNLLGYSKWENFEKVIQKAKDACLNAGELIENHFPDIRKMVEIGSSTERPVNDMALTRYACYVIAQNGDSRGLLPHALLL